MLVQVILCVFVGQSVLPSCQCPFQCPYPCTIPTILREVFCREYLRTLIQSRTVNWKYSSRAPLSMFDPLLVVGIQPPQCRSIALFSEQMPFRSYSFFALRSRFRAILARLHGDKSSSLLTPYDGNYYQSVFSSNLRSFSALK
jgi:hypothetical protein